MRKMIMQKPSEGLKPSEGSKKYSFGKILSLAIFLMVLFASSGQQAKSEDGVIWTKDFGIYYILNAVFSPDDQFIYATCTDIYYVIKYDLQGNILDTIKNVGGIRKFSEDGKYFWNYNGDKYDATTFEKLYSFGGGGYNIYGWNFEVNQNANIAIACAYGKEKRTQYRVFFDSNLIVLNLSDMKIQRFTSYPDNQEFGFSKASIHPDGQRAAFLVSSEIINEGSYYPVTDKMRIEIWKIPEFVKEREINIQIPASSTPLILRYSPDGSVLGYQHDGKLTLYSTTDYSVVWESVSCENFGWSKDMRYLYISRVGEYTQKLNSITKKLLATYSMTGSSRYYNLNSTQSQLLLSYDDFLIVLADNNYETSVSDPFFTTEYTISPNPAGEYVEIDMEKLNPTLKRGVEDQEEIQIYNNMGELVMTETIHPMTPSHRMNIEHLPAGVYFVKIGDKFAKFVKE